MLEVIITSSVLIVVVLALRLLLKKRVSRRLIYALWLLVLLRLLIPVNFVQSGISVMAPVGEAASAASAAVEQAAARAEALAAAGDASSAAPMLSGGAVSPEVAPDDGDTAGIADPGTVDSSAQSGQNTAPGAARPPLWVLALRLVQASNYRLLKIVWLAGAAAVGLWFLFVNLAFRRALRKKAVPIRVVRCPLPLYWCEDIPSPCLVGLFRPSIYITRFSADERDKLGDVVTHELCHWRQGDHIWTILRCVCVAAYWFNPLVWVAARVSRADCELACDEAAVKKLGEARRIEYGRTLVRMIGERGKYSDRGVAATAMTANKKGIRERITQIAARPKRSVVCAVTLVLCAALVCACTFSGAPDAAPAPDAPVSEAVDARLLDASLVVNPLTGQEGIAADRVGMKPLGFVVDNLPDCVLQ